MGVHCYIPYSSICDYQIVCNVTIYTTRLHKLTTMLLLKTLLAFCGGRDKTPSPPWVGHFHSTPSPSLKSSETSNVCACICKIFKVVPPSPPATPLPCYAPPPATPLPLLRLSPPATPLPLLCPLPLLRPSPCYAPPPATPLPLLRPSPCYAPPPATPLPLLRPSPCYAPPPAMALPRPPPHS